MTLGKFPAMDVNSARSKARSLIGEVESGIDVKEAQRSARNEDKFAQVFYDWLEKHAKPHKRSWDEDLRRYKLYMERSFGNKPISWFNTEGIRRWHHDLTRQPKQRGEGLITGSTANRALALLSTIFSQMRPFDTNPCRGVKKFKENSRSRFLQPSELQRFFRELDARETPELFRDYIYISLLTGARRSNILSMRWSEIDVTSRLWRIPSNKSKNAEEMTVPLTREAIDILERRKRTARSVFVFPSSGKTGHLQEPRRPWKNLLNRADIDDLRLHDLRRTLGSYQTITGASTAIVGKTLGHKSPEATAVYARLNLDPVRQSIENATAAMLALKEAPDKIITITPAKGNTGT
jgi:integrase